MRISGVLAGAAAPNRLWRVLGGRGLPGRTPQEPLKISCTQGSEESIDNLSPRGEIGTGARARRPPASALPPCAILHCWFR